MQNWQDITNRGYQAIFDTEDGDEIIVQQLGPMADLYAAQTPGGAISDALNGEQVEGILHEFGARSCTQGSDNE